MKVLAAIKYYAWAYKTDERNNPYYNVSRDLTKAVKGDKTKYNHVHNSILGKDISDKTDSIAYWISSIKELVRDECKNYDNDKWMIVAVPSSQNTSKDWRTDTPNLMADALRSAIWPTAQGMTGRVTSLFFKKVMKDVRDVNVLVENMQAYQTRKETNVILVDDVYTTGAHLRAARKVLEESGMNVRFACVLSRTISSLIPNSEDMLNPMWYNITR